MPKKRGRFWGFVLTVSNQAVFHDFSDDLYPNIVPEAEASLGLKICYQDLAES